MQVRETIKDDGQAVALQAIVWILAEASRAERFLALTGLVPEDLRTRIADPVVLDAALGFLEGHQPDFIACADALGLSPERLAAARGALSS
jgi:Protein of unknown function (DUF3572)